MSSSAVTLGPSSTDAIVDSCPDTAMERILQEISAVGRRLEATDSKIKDLSADSKSIRVNVAGFQDKVTDLGYRLHTVESRLAALPDKEQELQFLRHKLTDLEDRSQRENPTDLRSLLDGLYAQPMDHEPADLMSSHSTLRDSILHKDADPGAFRIYYAAQKRRRFLDRPPRSQDGRDMALQAVANIT
ncbi:hypothetical protein NDU88_000490 [Pleurodeles waltl]|uniref:Uncharacterized protein n=1 Tax=Pleurodeles waltl TaxID=8319 RepID=A0AAV7S5U2_PLEWA|nr:hypothetical protein NDU88_000490 [Pleurodeles waltl]